MCLLQKCFFLIVGGKATWQHLASPKEQLSAELPGELCEGIGASAGEPVYISWITMGGYGWGGCEAYA